MNWKWFGTKTLYRWEASGKSSHTDRRFDGSATLVEERIVILKARNFNEAISKSEKEAQDYCSDQIFKNLYGESVSIRFLKCCDAFELFEAPDSNVEVYSNNFITDKQVKDKELVNRFLGKRETKMQKESRRRFMNAELLEEFSRK